MSPIQFVGLFVWKVYCGKTANLDAIWGGEWGRSGMGVLDVGGDRRREGAVLGVNLWRPVVTNGDAATRSSQITLTRTC